MKSSRRGSRDHFHSHHVHSLVSMRSMARNVGKIGAISNVSAVTRNLSAFSSPSNIINNNTSCYSSGREDSVSATSAYSTDIIGTHSSASDHEMNNLNLLQHQNSADNTASGNNGNNNNNNNNNTNTAFSFENSPNYLVAAAAAAANDMSFHEKYQRSKKKEKTLKNGIVRFNMKPSGGIKFLTSNQLLENSASGIAKFLFNQKGLSKVQIGEFLGGEKEMNIAVMHNFIDNLKFANMEFVDALRYLCSIFMLPPEGQKIDRILERFAQRYTDENPETYVFSLFLLFWC